MKNRKVKDDLIILPSSQMQIKPKYGYSDFYNDFTGDKKVGKDGYLYVKILRIRNGKKRFKFEMEHRFRAELALGKRLKKETIVHHHGANQLVICENSKYHNLLHDRIKEKGCFGSLWKDRVKEDLFLDIDSHNSGASVN